MYIEDGHIAEIPTSRADADTIINARGLIAAPGLIDTHVHPTFGDFTPTQNSLGWQHAYLHGGVTSLVSPYHGGTHPHATERHGRGGQ